MRSVIFFLMTITLALNSSFVSVHDYFVSITTIDHRKDSKLFEISIKLTAHDIEKAVRSKGDLKLGSSKELKNADIILENYIKNHFSIWINGKLQPLHFKGKEIETDETLYLFFTTPAPKNLTTVKLINRILTKTFPDQENITYFNSGIKKKTYTFKKYNSIKEFKFQ